MLFDSRYPRSTRHWKVNSISSWQKHLFKLICSWRYDAYSVFRQWVLGCGLWKICLIIGNTSSGYEHPVLLQLSVVIYIKLSFLGLWHQMQTYLSYRWLQLLLHLCGSALETQEHMAHSTAALQGLARGPWLMERAGWWLQPVKAHDLGPHLWSQHLTRAPHSTVHLPITCVSSSKLSYSFLCVLHLCRGSTMGIL